jgi:hypothetical protein|tara:strand:- start:67 stop:765 length:699 start_codon:yes stop_codon:yes gene_type:complete
MKSLQLFDTKKLFYKTYLYKLDLNNCLNFMFRTGLQKGTNLEYARGELDELARKYRAGEPLVRTVFRSVHEVSIDDYLDAKDLYLILKNETNYKVRIENRASISIYTNNKELLDKIVMRLRQSAVGLWGPRKGTKNILTPEVILVNTEPEFPIRVMLKDVRISPDFATWLRANRDKARIGDTALHCIDKHMHMTNFYFHVRDEKVMSIAYMLIGHAIRDIYNLVYMPAKNDK